MSQTPALRHDSDLFLQLNDDPHFVNSTIAAMISRVIPFYFAKINIFLQTTKDLRVKLGRYRGGGFEDVDDLERAGDTGVIRVV